MISSYLTLKYIEKRNIKHRNEKCFVMNNYKKVNKMKKKKRSK
jgi:hypothetical protein